MTAFVIGMCIGIMVSIVATIPGEREYGQLMYRRGYSQAIEDMNKKKTGDCD